MAKIGSAQITLADLTDERPARLDLATSLRIIQAQTGTVYDPDYSIGEGQVITPSLFFGHSEVAPEKYLKEIYYNCSDEGDEKDYRYDPDFQPDENRNISYVDNLGRFHLRRNLNDSIVIEANINKVIDEQTGVEYSSFSERITLYKVSYESGYSAFIISEDGRYDFEGDNSNSITLISKLYYGASEVEENKIISRNWYRSANDEKVIKENSKTYTVERASVFGHETFICETKIEGGLTFRAQIGIDDRTDSFYSIISAEGTTILTPLNNKVQLSCEIWKGNEKYSDGDITYNWYYIINSISTELTVTTSNFIAELDGSILPKQSLTLYCQAEIKENDVVVGKPINFIPIQYTNPYTVILTPDTVFIPVNSDGSFKGTEFEKEISLEIRGENGELLSYDISTSDFILPSNDGAISFEETTTIENSSLWKRTFILKINKSENLEKWDSKNFEVRYKYLGVEGLVKTFDVFKNYQGIPGEQGYSGFTVDLTNSFHKFAGEERWATPGQSTKFSYIGKIADEDLVLEKITINDENKTLYSKDTTIVTVSEVKIEPGLYLTYNNPEFTLFTASSDSGEYLESIDKSFKINFTFSHSKLTSNITITKLFNYGFTQTGNSYSLYIDPTSIIYSPSTNTFNYSQITIKSQYQSGGKGPFLPYNNGKVYYSLNEADYSALELTNGTGFIKTSLLNSSMKQLSVRLYKSDASSIEDTKNLVDEETIPIITSMDGTEIGGENLLTWSRTFSTENRWAYNIENPGISIEPEKNFNVINFSNALQNEGLFSPKISLEKDYLDKSFCFSCLVYSDNWDSIGSDSLEIQLGGYLSNNLTRLRNCYGTIGTITKNSGTIIFEEENRKNGTWQKVYKTFILNNSFFNKTESANGISSIYNCNEIDLLFYLNGSSSQIKIKKPKLEIGNTPTDWSPSFEDNEFLISEIEKQLEGTKKDFGDKILKISSEALKVTIDENKTADLYIIESIDKQQLTKYENSFQPITITGTNGNYTFLTLEDFSNYLEELNKSNAKQFANYSSTLIDTNLNEYRSAINIQAATATQEGFISISTVAYTEANGYSQISEALKLTSNRLEFRLNGKETAYMSNNKLFIPNGQVTESLILGKDPANENIDSHLKIFTSDNGVGFIWEEEEN